MTTSDIREKETTFTRHLYDDELDTILAIAKNEQTGRVTPFEIRELVRVYSLVPELYEALQRVNDAAYVDENTGKWRLPESFDTGFIDAALAKARGEESLS